MSLTTIRAAVKTKLESVSGVENVKDFVIWSDEWDPLLTYFVKEGRVNTWQIGLQNSIGNLIDNGNRTRNFLFNLYGLYSIKTADETSKTFEGICDAVVNEFSESKSFLIHTETSPAQLISFENAIFMNSPAHRALIQVLVIERTHQDLS